MVQRAANMINKETAIPLALVLLLAGGVFGGARAWFSQTYAINELRSEMELMRRDINHRFELIEASINQDRWHASNQKDWAHDLRIQNIGMSVPDPRDYIVQ